MCPLYYAYIYTAAETLRARFALRTEGFQSKYLAGCFGLQGPHQGYFFNLFALALIYYNFFLKFFNFFFNFIIITIPEE